MQVPIVIFAAATQPVPPSLPAVGGPALADSQAPLYLLSTVSQSAAALFALVVTIAFVLAQVQPYRLPLRWIMRPNTLQIITYFVFAAAILLPVWILLVEWLWASLVAALLLSVAVVVLPFYVWRLVDRLSVTSYLEAARAETRDEYASDMSLPIAYRALEMHDYDTLLDATRSLAVSVAGEREPQSVTRALGSLMFASVSDTMAFRGLVLESRQALNPLVSRHVCEASVLASLAICGGGERGISLSQPGRTGEYAAALYREAELLGSVAIDAAAAEERLGTAAAGFWIDLSMGYRVADMIGEKRDESVESCLELLESWLTQLSPDTARRVLTEWVSLVSQRGMWTVAVPGNEAALQEVEKLALDGLIRDLVRHKFDWAQTAKGNLWYRYFPDKGHFARVSIDVAGHMG